MIANANAPELLHRSTIRDLEASLFRYARRKVATDDAARELVQETWVAALAALPTYAGRSSLRTWLTSILRRKIADLYRQRRAASAEIEDTPTEEDLFALIIAREEAERVQQAMAELSPREREAVELCGLEELDRDEAASRMGLSRPCLRVTLCRGRRHLRELAESPMP